jgi:hypothetical protein
MKLNVPKDFVEVIFSLGKTHRNTYTQCKLEEDNCNLHMKIVAYVLLCHLRRPRNNVTPGEQAQLLTQSWFITLFFQRTSALQRNDCL